VPPFLQGRTVLWAWMQEKQQLRPAGAYDSACCLCVPRVLYLSQDGSRLLQEPLPELAGLRQQRGAWHIGMHVGEYALGNGGANAFQAPQALLPGVPLKLGVSSSSSRGSSSSSHVDVEITLTRGEAESVVLLLQPFEGLFGAAGAGIAYCWATDTLQVRRCWGLGLCQPPACCLYLLKHTVPPAGCCLPAFSLPTSS
jgi:hypothetical protein